MNNQWRANANLMVVWADGTYDAKRACDECGLETCHTPVHNDHYREIGHTDLEIREDEMNALSYWNHMHSNRPLGAKLDFDGELVVREFFTANPDGLPEGSPRSSGVTEMQYQLAQEAYNTFSPRQKQVWDLVMRDQVDVTEAAKRLAVAHQNVSDYLNTAKSKFKTYLEENKNRVSA